MGRRRRVHRVHPAGEYAYAECYAGVAGTGFSAQLSHAPRYFGLPVGATYAQLNLAPFSERDLAPIAHIGFLRTNAAAGYSALERWDTRIGLAYSRDLLTVQLAWSAVTERESDRRAKPGWVLRLTRWL